MTEQAYFRGAGGVVFLFDLPLSEPYQEQVDKRLLIRCDENGEELTGSGPQRPKDYDTKAKWEGFAVSQGMDPELAAEATKKDLVELYGQS